MSQKDRIKAYLLDIAPAKIAVTDLAEALEIPVSSCRTIVAMLANIEGSCVHRGMLGYYHEKPTTLEHLEMQEMYWHDLYLSTKQKLQETEAVAYELIAQQADNQQRITLQNAAITALKALIDFDNKE